MCIRDRVVADMRGAWLLAANRLVRHLDALAGNFAFGQGALLGQLFDDVPVAVAGCEIHVAVYVVRIFAQLLVDGTRRFNEFTPIHGAEQAQAANAVADRHLVGRLALGFRLDQLLDGLAGFGQALLDPGERQGQCRTVPLQAARQFGDEGIDQRRIGPCHVGNDQDKVCLLYTSRCV